MLLHGIAPDVIAEHLSISDEELQSRRAMMLRALKRDGDRPRHRPVHTPRSTTSAQDDVPVERWRDAEP